LLNRLGVDAASFREKDADDVQVLRSAPSQDDVVTELGYEQLKRHSLRHPGLTWMADAGLPLHVLRNHRRMTCGPQEVPKKAPGSQRRLRQPLDRGARPPHSRR
jgi:hypothetical protein